MSLEELIVKKEARVCIIGLGYVGLPLAVEFGKSGFNVTGIDLDEKRVARINAGESYISDVDSEDLNQLVGAGRLTATSNFDILAMQDCISICVPTPLRKTKEPDVSHIMLAVQEVKRCLREKQLVVLESTTFPGTTDEIILPLLQSEKMRVGKDFYLAFSPERVDPGNKKHTTKNIPKVVGGVTSSCLNMVKLLYEQVVERVVPVSSPKVAEMVKLLENTFRNVNIALVNELAMICDRFEIDVWEVIEAAATKPFGFTPFYPGPGLGGHCIPIDPYYLTWKARLHDFEARFIDLASEINRQMPRYVVEKVCDALNERRKSAKGSRILILGVAYKRDINDGRESPAQEIIKLLRKRGAEIEYNDPYIAQYEVNGEVMRSVELSKEVLGEADCVTVVTDHSCYHLKDIVRNAQLIVDTRNAFKGVKGAEGKVVRL